MPNYVYVKLSVMGKDQRLGEFTRQANGTRKPSGDLPTFPDGRENLNYIATPPVSVLEFDRLVPLPESYRQFSYSDHGQKLEIQTWGIKWGAFGHKPPKFEEGCATYDFTCAWDAPHFFLEKVSKEWNDLWFVVSYGGEGPVRGRFALHDGRYLENIDEIGSNAAMTEEEWENQYDVWVNAYRDAHIAYTKIILFNHIVAVESAPVVEWELT